MIERNHPILISGELPDLPLAPVITKKLLSFERPSLQEPFSYEYALEEAVGEEIPFEALRAFSSDAEEWTGVYQGKRLIGIENGDTRAHQYGVAVDIGTTTMVLSLVDLQTGRLLESAKELNPQIPFGQEVIAWIAYVVKHGKQGLLEEQAAVIKVICQMIQEVCQKTQVPSEFIYEVSVAGNPTMTHLLLGVDPRTIGRSPYVLTLQKGKSIPCSVVGLNGLSPFAQLAALPTVSSYIGSDILGGDIC